MSRHLLAGLLILAATPALAQTGSTFIGPPVAGVCLLSQQAVFANAKVGVAFAARLKQLADQAQAELDAERIPLEADAKALAADTKLKPAEKASRTQALTTRAQALQQKAALRQRELEATRQKVLTRLSAEENPVLAQVFKAHNCGLLFDRNTVLGGNMSGDLTAEVVRGLDARITTITFDRETLPPTK